MVSIKKIIRLEVKKILGGNRGSQRLREELEEAISLLMKAERRSCINAVCYTCSCEDPPVRGRHEWIHRGGDRPFCCPASKIWEMAHGDA